MPRSFPAERKASLPDDLLIFLSGFISVCLAQMIIGIAQMAAAGQNIRNLRGVMSGDAGDDQTLHSFRIGIGFRDAAGGRFGYRSQIWGG